MFKIANAGDFKRTLASVALAAVVATCTPAVALAQNTNGVTWNYDEATATLTISGTGAMDSYDPETGNAAPWADKLHVAKKLVITDGVTSIGANAFKGMDNLLTAVVPETITTIGEGAFYGCYSLDNFGYGNNKYASAVIKGNVTYLGQDAFRGCSKMRDIYLEATDLKDYHFDTLDSQVGWQYDFNNPNDTTIHVAKGFGDHITLDQCESLYQWQRVAGDKAPIVADLDVAGTVKGDRGQQAADSKAAATKKSADKAAADGLKATSTENANAQKELAAKRNAAVPGAKAAASQKAADKAAADGLKATSTENANAQKELAAKRNAAVPGAKAAASQKAAEKAAADGVKATSAENNAAQQELAAKRNAAAPAAKAAASQKAAEKAAADGLTATSTAAREVAAEQALVEAQNRAAAADAKAKTVAKAETEAAEAGAFALEIQTISTENRTLQGDLAAKGAAALTNTSVYATKAAEQAKEIGEKAEQAQGNQDNVVPKKRDNDRPGI